MAQSLMEEYLEYHRKLDIFSQKTRFLEKVEFTLKIRVSAEKVDFIPDMLGLQICVENRVLQVCLMGSSMNSNGQCQCSQLSHVYTLYSHVQHLFLPRSNLITTTAGGVGQGSMHKTHFPKSIKNSE